MDSIDDIQSGLTQASIKGRTDIVRSAIEGIKKIQADGTEIDLKSIVSKPRDEDGATALHLATYYNHPDVVRALLNVDCNLDTLGYNGEYKDKRPYDCCHSSNINDNNDKTKEAYHIFLFEAVAMNRSDRVINLLNGGIKYNIIDSNLQKETLLHWSCSFEHIDVTRTLLSYSNIGRSYTVLYYTVLNYTILYYTIQYCCVVLCAYFCTHVIFSYTLHCP